MTVRQKAPQQFLLIKKSYIQNKKTKAKKLEAKRLG
jgi:hypothetical protein